MDPVITQSLFILGLPLLSYVLTFFFGEKLPRRGDFIGIGLMGVVLALSIKIFVQFWGIADSTFQIPATTGQSTRQCAATLGALVSAAR